MGNLKDSMVYTVLNDAATVEHDGDVWFAGDVYTGDAANPKKLATEEFVNASRTCYEDVLFSFESDPDYGLFPIKVSDEILTRENLVGVKVQYLQYENPITHVIDSDIIENETYMMAGMLNDTGLYAVFVALTDNVVIDIDNDKIVLPEKGTYLMNYSFLAARSFSKSIVGTLDPKFLPDSVKLPTVTEEDNGKILKVVNGVWTAVDPSV